MHKFDVKYTYDNTKLTFVKADSNIGTITASAGEISWNGTPLTQIDDTVLFTITFTVINSIDVYGITYIKFNREDTKIGTSAAFDFSDTSIDLGDAPKAYDIKVYVQSDLVPVDEPNYELNTALSKNILSKDKTISLTEADINNLVKDTLNSNEYEYVPSKSNTSGNNDGTLVLNLYFKKIVYKVNVNINGNEKEIKYFYNQALTSTEFNEFVKDFVDAKNTEGYNVAWKDAADTTGSVINNVTKNIENLIPVTTPIDYTITYDLGGVAADNKNPTTYNVETPTFELIDLEDTAEKFFAGWFDAAGENANRIEKIEKGTKGNITIYAHWDDATIFIKAGNVTNGIVPMDIKLTDIPKDIDDIGIIELEYTFDSSKLEYVGVESHIGGDFIEATAGKIVWSYDGDNFKLFGNSDEKKPVTIIPDGKLFTVRYNVREDAEGITVMKIKKDTVSVLSSNKTSTSFPIYDLLYSISFLSDSSISF